jgi:hypothetical protein
LEIYNEELRDLLHPETSSKQLSIREDASGNIVVAGAQSRSVQTPEDVMRLLAMGTAARVTGSTNMNEQSSRSHAIFTLILQQKDVQSGEFTHAKFHLVDLAGSERAKRTGAVGKQLKVRIRYMSRKSWGRTSVDRSTVIYLYICICVFNACNRNRSISTKGF